ncbi:unnamed protein product [Calypogeia fissa]
MTVRSILHNQLFSYTKDDVKHCLRQLQAGYTGNTRFALGACREAREAYKCAEKSKSLLLQAGLGNVHMRLSIQDQEAGSNSVSSQTKISGGAEGSQLEFEVARKHYTKALEIYTDLGYKEGQRIVHCNLGNLYHKRTDIQQALNQYKTATTYCSRMMHGGPTALLLHLKFAEVYLEIESREAARESLQKLPEFHRNLS